MAPYRKAHDRARATVVVIHETAAVLELVEQSLRDAGHHVFATRDRREAVDVIRAVVVDLAILGDRNGDGDPDLVRVLQATQPSIRVMTLGRDAVALRTLEEAVVTELRR